MKNLILIFLMFFHSTLWAQEPPPPPIDKNWELITLKSDEFNDTTIDTEKWKKCTYNWGIRENSNGVLGGGILLFNDPIHCYENNGYLNLVATPYTGTPFYFSGGVQSKNHDYSYGYFEISAYLPGWFNNNQGGQSWGEGFWPAFWTYYTEDSPPGCRIIHDEVDILEPCGYDFIHADKNVVGWHDEKPPCDAYKVKNIEIENLPPLFLQEHTYSAKILQDRIIFYFDGNPFYSTHNGIGYPTHSQYTVIDFQVDGQFAPPSNTPWPQSMRVNYYRYWELKFDCQTDVYIKNNAQLYAFVYSVKRNIYFGIKYDKPSLSTIPITLSGTEPYIFRASEGITIYGNFETILGTELYLLPTLYCN